MRFIDYEELWPRFVGKRVAIVGSAPSCAQNDPKCIDAFDIVVRINNYKIVNNDGIGTGCKTDVHYSFYGTSIKTSRERLIRDGVQLCMCKCPDADAIDSEWHRRNGKTLGTDFRWIYRKRMNWWPCDTYVPDKESFLYKFQALDNHIPSTGIAAVMDVFGLGVREIYLTGFDFFQSRKHNVDEPWCEGRKDDPIRHRSDLELAWLRKVAHAFPFRFDSTLENLMRG